MTAHPKDTLTPNETRLHLLIAVLAVAALAIGPVDPTQSLFQMLLAGMFAHTVFTGGKFLRGKSAGFFLFAAVASALIFLAKHYTLIMGGDLFTLGAAIVWIVSGLHMITSLGSVRRSSGGMKAG